MHVASKSLALPCRPREGPPEKRNVFRGLTVDGRTKIDGYGCTAGWRWRDGIMRSASNNATHDGMAIWRWLLQIASGIRLLPTSTSTEVKKQLIIERSVVHCVSPLSKKMTYLGIVASGRRVAVSLSRSSKAPTASFARYAYRSMMPGTYRHVTSIGSHSLGDYSSSFRHNRSNGPTNSSSSLKNIIHSRAIHASPARHQSSDDFAIRARQFGLASKEEVALAAEDPSTVFLDVRSPPEIEDASLTNRPCVEIWCTMDDTSRLSEEAVQLIPDKDGEFSL